MSVIVADSDAESLLRAVAAYGLAGTQHRLPATTLAPPAWRRLRDDVAYERLAGHLAAAVATGDLATTDAQRDEAAALHLSASVLALRLDRMLAEVVAALAEAGVEHRVLKGVALALTAYDDPSWRSYGDVDLLVPAEGFDAAVDVVSRLGGERTWPELRRGFDARFGKGATFAMPGGLELDLHRTFASGYYGLAVHLGELFATGQPLRVGSTEVVALGPEHRFLHACFHAALGHLSRLTALRDVAQLLLRTELDGDAILATAKAWGCEAVVARAVSRAWSTLALVDAVALSVWAQRYEPSGRDVRLMEAYSGRAESEAARARASLRAIHGIGAKAAFVRAVVLPDSSYLRWANERPWSWLRRGSRALPHPGRRPR